MTESCAAQPEQCATWKTCDEHGCTGHCHRTLRDQVFESLNNARANGYDYSVRDLLSDVVVAIDMIACDAGLEGRTTYEITPYIAEWREYQRGLC